MIICSGYNYKGSSANVADCTWRRVALLYLDRVSLGNLFFS
jgi:hypothetical protein